MSESKPSALAILAVEDDPLIARFLVDALVGCGHEVQHAACGAQAHELARARKFDLLLLDIQLPDTAGDQLLAALRGDPGVLSRAAPAIAMSGDLPPDRRSELLAIGFREAWQKPVPLATLEALATTGIGLPGGVASQAQPPQTLDLDDDDAVTRLGSVATMKALRGLLAGELPRQWQAICIALDGGDFKGAASVIHRARAGCALCGANAAASALAAIETSLQIGQDTASVRAQADVVITRTLERLIA